jgi:cytochrome c556
LKKIHIALGTAAVLGFSLLAQAQQDHGHALHQAPQSASPAGDARQLVHFPAEMREHTLSNMRDHLQVLSEIIAAMSAGQLAKAADIAEARLGMDSPSAAGCQSNDSAAAAATAKATTSDHQMAKFMPEGMQRLGLEMHQSASVFAAEAKKVRQAGDADKKAMAALAQVTRQCVACHDAYRVH